MTMQVTQDEQRWSNAAEDTIEVVDPDPSWPGQFVTEFCAIQQVLLKEFKLPTIVRLPNGVFAPCTGIPANVLFFDRSGPAHGLRKSWAASKCFWQNNLL